MALHSKMPQWQQGDTLIVRNIARSDGTVTTATPAITISEERDLLALYIPQGTPFKDNWVVSPEQRAASVDDVVPSAQRHYRDLIHRNDSIRLYLPGHGYSIGLSFDEQRGFVSWYGNLEAPFVRTRLGIDTRDFALDIVATSDREWHWKDEDEFARRLAVGIDSAEHQARVRAAGQDFIIRLTQNTWPFNAGWEQWQPLQDWQVRELPDDWADDLGTNELLSVAVW